MKTLFTLLTLLLPSLCLAQTGGANQLAHGTLAQRPAACKVSRGEVYYQTDPAGDGAGTYECGPGDNQWRRKANASEVMAEAGTRASADSSEASARAAADAAEASARAAGDAALQANIDAEATARASAITSSSTEDRARSNHTGTQSADTLTDGTTNKAFTATERTKLSGIATGATANQTDAYLLSRANHTGTQPYTTVTGLGTAATKDAAAAGTSGAVLNADDPTTTNARTPTAHAPTHAAAGSDPVSIAASQVTSGVFSGSLMPALSGDVTTSAGSTVTTLASVVTPGSCTTCNLTFDAKGRITAASNGTGGVTSVNGQTGAVSLTLPANTTATASQWFTAYNSATGAFTKAQPSFSDLSGSATDAQVPDSLTLTSGSVTGGLGYTPFNAAGDTLTGTAGAGFAGFPAQSSSPSTPGSGFRFFADSSGRLSWKGSNGFVRTFDGTGNTADRAYTLPDAAGTVVLDTAAQALTNKTLTGTGTLSFGASPAASGQIRLPNNVSVSFRNAANSNDVLALTVNSSNQVQIGNNSAQLSLAALWDINNATGNLKAAGANYQLTFGTGIGITGARSAVVGLTNGSTAGGSFAAVATTAAQLTADQNNYNPGGSSLNQRWSSDAARTVTGLTFSAAQVDGETHYVWNVGGQNLVLANESASSTAANRFTTTTGADLTVAPNRCALIMYDATSARWRAALLP